MAQYLKESVREAIVRGALLVLAERGYDSTTMAEIAEASSISVGNIYRYFRSKTELYEAIITDDFVSEFEGLIRKRVRALSSTRDIRELEASAPYHVISEELFRFSLSNRRKIVVLLGQSAGTRRECYREQLVEILVGIAIEYARGLEGGYEGTEIDGFNIRLIYRNYVDGLCRILSVYEDEESLRQSIEGYSRYHLAGMKAVFG